MLRMDRNTAKSSTRASAGPHPPYSIAATPPESIMVPDGLANIVIEAAKATDDDHLLQTNGAAHE